jgi:predicted metal-dependent hydrolase
MSKFSSTHLKEITEGLELFNAGKYWECHEVLEDPWMEYAHDSVRYIFWAIIQIAVCLYHVRGANLLGACGMLKKAKEKLDTCEKLELETPLLESSLDWNHFKFLVREIKQNPSLGDFKRLLNFKFVEVR